jgi:hypothetical protein
MNPVCGLIGAQLYDQAAALSPNGRAATVLDTLEELPRDGLR